jgi:pimeloyl-ACP methyl ester carboxylesterase
VRCAALINPTNLVSLPYLVLLRAAPPRLVEAFSRGIVRRSVVRFVLRRLVYANPACVTPQDVDEYWSPTRLPGFGFAARASLGEFDWSPVSDELADRLAVPTLVMLGDADRLVHNTERDARRLRGAIVRVVPGGHSAQEENPGAAYAALAEFLAGGWQ